ncbi:hypothetical protein Kpol_1058p28 [Vanderwaltozyma polyspora DSM 70294]|uniref:Efficient mitochondria targeting-associated protein 19 n=1 Tax=Vanderwaltozyma polyspora (strain ATCC 22028 / DSM 70294 / BCRC 21397 / CBS 2163 / NBRC 10782 / NRRL Y-8283 / UCD 57-17) TaxID=436907 RepID=A7TJR2_VANPO|nr:uncharacterized protein Kpol_1058p28 [Vanderwaltozyma polyspora DSM 70294]EDO17491.1 hypothetical protein Kpol_1058p28 [Vanderwaltozyma polyspora DSM 70294]
MLTSFDVSFYYYYFLLHIPITLCIDSSVVIPLEWYPNLLQNLIKFHINNNNDFLLADKPLWLVIFVLIELVVQLPLFVYFTIYLPRLKQGDSNLANDDKVEKRSRQEFQSRLNWWLKLYGFNASLTTLICIVVIYFNGHQLNNVDIAMTLNEKLSLIGVYLPTFLIPLRLCFI